MIEMEMSKDIKDYSPKVIGIFDKRQCICVAIACFIGFPLWSFLDKFELSMEVTCLIIMLAVAFPISCGWVKMYGLYFDVFLVACVFPMMFSPMKRRYKTVNTLAYLDPQPPAPSDPKQIKRNKMNRVQKKKFKADRQKYGAAS